MIRGPIYSIDELRHPRCKQSDCAQSILHRRTMALFHKRGRTAGRLGPGRRARCRNPVGGGDRWTSHASPGLESRRWGEARQAAGDKGGGGRVESTRGGWGARRHGPPRPPTRKRAAGADGGVWAMFVCHSVRWRTCEAWILSTVSCKSGGRPILGIP